MPVSKETQNRIKKEARKHWLNIKGDHAELDYIAGATTEAERSALLVEALEKVRKISGRSFTRIDLMEITDIIDDTLNQYNSPEIKE